MKERSAECTRVCHAFVRARVQAFNRYCETSLLLMERPLYRQEITTAISPLPACTGGF